MTVWPEGVTRETKITVGVAIADRLGDGADGLALAGYTARRVIGPGHGMIGIGRAGQAPYSVGAGIICEVDGLIGVGDLRDAIHGVISSTCASGAARICRCFEIPARVIGA